MTRKTIFGDILWGFVLLIWILILVLPTTRTAFLGMTEDHPYLGGFIKFAILATMGDLLGLRIQKREWVLSKGLIFKAILWGILGIMITLVFTVYSGGTSAAQESGRLPFNGVTLAHAFFAAAIMNLTFGPMMYVYHKFGDLYIDACYDIRTEKITIEELVKKVDWYTLVSFSWLKTCLFVWIPCHTIVFLLPSEYRVLASAFLSILLGVLVAISKMKVQNSDAIEI